MIDKLKLIKDRYKELSDKLSDTKVLLDKKQVKIYGKELSELSPIYNLFLKYEKLVNDINEAQDLLKTDPEYVDYAKEIIKESNLEKVKVENEIKKLLIPKDKLDYNNAIIEIRGATGGDEANIFAGDLYRMYVKYLEDKKYTIDTLEVYPSPVGGFTKISFIVKGKGAYGLLKFETGSHRVQRVPNTESQGRVHTSTSTVLVMPEVNEDINIDISEKNLKIDVFRSGGAGGQSVNTTDSAVRITHLPSGVVVTCQDGRSQHENKDKALKILKAKLYDIELQKQQEEKSQDRMNKLGRGTRSEKIRTYNYPQNRVTDHRISLTLNYLNLIMEGKLDKIIISLQNEYAAYKLKEQRIEKTD